MTKLLKEPLLHFLLLGAALFLLFGWRGNSASAPGGQAATPSVRIVVGRNTVDQMISQYAKTWQRAPTEEEQACLIEDYIRSEIYYREALAIGLDRDDEVMKRRLRQRMEFLYEDISSWAEPSDEDLRKFMEGRREKYLTDLRIAFRQVFVNATERGKDAEAVAGQFLKQLTQGADPDSVGDPTMLAPEVSLSPLWDIRKQFGDGFASSLVDLKPGAWTGPIRSSYGLHLVLVKERVGQRLPDLKDIRETLKRDWIAQRQTELKDAAYAKIRQRYTVTVEKPAAPGAGPAAAASAGGRTQ